MHSTTEKTSTEADWIEDDPYGMRLKGQNWLKAELALNPSPLDLSNAVEVKELSAALEASCETYGSRDFEEDQEKRNRPVLVAIGMPHNYCIPDALDCRGMRFLFVGNLDVNDGEKTNAWFLTYMTSPTHGAVDGAIMDSLARNLPESFGEGVCTRRNSGSHEKGGQKPDGGYFPQEPYDITDVDPENEDNPFSRMLVEVEVFHREGVLLRALGYKYMENEFTRLFLAVKVYSDEDATGNFGAAIVLWEKGRDDDEVRVNQAVSFGTRALNLAELHQFSESVNKLLVGVRNDRWTNQVNGDITSAYENFTIQKETSKQILYKVRDPESTSNPKALLSERVEIPALTINLKILRRMISTLLIRRFHHREAKRQRQG